MGFPADCQVVTTTSAVYVLLVSLMVVGAWDIGGVGFGLSAICNLGFASLIFDGSVVSGVVILISVLGFTDISILGCCTVLLLFKNSVMVGCCYVVCGACLDAFHSSHNCLHRVCLVVSIVFFALMCFIALLKSWMLVLSVSSTIGSSNLMLLCGIQTSWLITRLVSVLVMYTQ